MANLEPMPISSLPEGSIQDGDKMIIYRDSNGKAYQSDASSMESVAELKEEVDKLSVDLTNKLNYTFPNTQLLTDTIDGMSDGWYFGRIIATGDAQSVTGMPISANYVLEVGVYGNTAAVVLAFPVNSDYFYMLRKTSSTWRSWRSVSTSTAS